MRSIRSSRKSRWKDEHGVQFLVYRSAEEDASVDAIIKDEDDLVDTKVYSRIVGVKPATATFEKNICRG